MDILVSVWQHVWLRFQSKFYYNRKQETTGKDIVAEFSGCSLYMYRPGAKVEKRADC